MNFVEAIKKKMPLKRAGKSTWKLRRDSMGPWLGTGTVNTISEDAFIDVEYLLSEVALTWDDFLADDWVVKEKVVRLTAKDIREAWPFDATSAQDALVKFLVSLGLN